jgi:molybdopterin-biosynthesis enzyme MoeA-like protein
MFKTASVFQPEHVNLFPGVPFEMWKMVADIGETDLEEALALIDNAFHEPGITFGKFSELVDPYQLPANMVQPLYLLGHIIKPFQNGKLLEVTLVLDTELQDWAKLLAEFPLIGKPVQVKISQPKAVM